MIHLGQVLWKYLKTHTKIFIIYIFWSRFYEQNSFTALTIELVLINDVQ